LTPTVWERSVRPRGRNATLAILGVVALCLAACDPNPPPPAPGAPSAVSAVPSPQAVTISWAAPVGASGSGLTYSVTSSPSVAPPASCTNTSALSCTFSGLTNGTSYTFTVVARNSTGPGPGASISAMPGSVPASPTSVTATNDDSQSVVRWVAPVANGTAPITGYFVTSSPAVAIPSGCTNTLNLTCTVTGLTDLTHYTFTVTAVNANGPSVGATVQAWPQPALSFSIAGTSPTVSSTSGTASPGLFPNFNPATMDYVSRCSAASTFALQLSVPATVTAVVNGQAFSGYIGSVQNINRDVNQSLKIVVVTNPSGIATTYTIRCLPTNFPTWTVSGSGTPQSSFYVTTLIQTSGQNLPVIFNTQGVPVWWTNSPALAGYTTLLGNGDIAYGNVQGGSISVVSLAGQLLKTISADAHDIQVLPSGAGPNGSWAGDYLVVQDLFVPNVDLSGLCAPSNPTDCGPASATLVDPQIQVLDPTTLNVVWRWTASDHIPITEMAPEWFKNYVKEPPTQFYDLYHWNSIDYSSHGLVLSFRHLDAIYDVDWSTGNIVWKLGGTTTAQSLTVDPSNDPVFASTPTGFGGQHDARLLPDGTLTLHDNGNINGSSSPLGNGDASLSPNRLPRFLRYQINTATMTATLLETRTDSAHNPAAGTDQSAFCCGSARKLPGGNWLDAVGGDSSFAETTPSDTTAANPVFRLTFTSNGAGGASSVLLYRVEPIFSNQLTASQLRDAMTSQFPDPTS
jgi:Arylsulfotransferase (ASST)/Fibronectin type III domain